MAFAEFGAYVRTSDNKRFFKRVLFDTVREENILTWYRNKYHNVDVYRSVFTYSEENFDRALIKGPLYFDLDFGVDFTKDHIVFREQTRHCIMTLQQYLKIPADQIYLYFSGGKGYHIIVPEEVLSLGYCDKRQLVRNYKDFATLMKIEWEQRYHTPSYVDLKVYDHRRMFRLPNSINSKGYRYKILLPRNTYGDVSYEDLSTMSMNISQYKESPGVFCPAAREQWDFLTEDTDEQAQQSVNKKKKSRHSSEILPCVNTMLQTGISQGKRNNTAVVLASTLFQQDFQFDEVLNIMIEWNSRNNPPLPDEELYNTIRSARNLEEKEWYYGCTAVKELGFCNNSCKVRKD